MGAWTEVGRILAMGGNSHGADGAEVHRRGRQYLVLGPPLAGGLVESSLRRSPPQQGCCLAGWGAVCLCLDRVDCPAVATGGSVAAGRVWLRLTEGPWYTSGISGVGLMIVGAVSGFLGWVLGLPVVYC